MLLCIYAWHNNPAITTMRFYDRLYRKLSEKNKIQMVDEMRAIMRKYDAHTK